MKNAREIYKFVEYWRNQDNDDFKVADTGNCSFKADVLYKYGGREIDQQTSVTIIRNGYSDGKISIDEVGVLSSAIFHLDFYPNYQDYEYDKVENSLVVKGNSDKMFGDYTVTITPI